MECKLLCNYLVHLVLIFSVCSVAAENTTITILLNKTLTYTDKQLYGDYFTIKSNSVIQVQLENVNNSVKFLIFQAHSHLYNVTLSFNIPLDPSNYTTGTNIGLYVPVNKGTKPLYVINRNSMDLKLYISVHGYTVLDPIPGGCTLVGDMEITPNLKVIYNQDYVRVDSTLAKGSVPCDKYLDEIGYKFYRMYTREGLWNQDGYFDGLKSMMSLKNVQENGVEVPKTLEPYILRMLSAYPGTGSVYVTKVYFKDDESHYALYVPSFTYACSPLDDSCGVLDDVPSQFFCAALFFIGLFTCYFGHRFFKTEMLLVGALAGAIVTYIVISINSDLDRPALLLASVISGICFGAIWLSFWWFYGIPVLAVLVPTLNLGFLVSALLYHVLPGGPLLTSDGIFWPMFVMVMVMTSLILMTTAFRSNIVCCAVLGAYATVFAVDHYVGANMKFIVINTVRRAVVERFNYAVLDPPYQWNDALLTMMWIVLSLTGSLFQHHQSRGKSPFPPPPRNVRPRAPDVIDYGTIVRNRRPISVENGMEPGSTPYLRESTTPLIG